MYNAACCTSYEYYIHTALEVVWNIVSNEAERKRCQFELLKLYKDARLRQKELDDVGHQLIQNLIIKNWN